MASIKISNKLEVPAKFNILKFANFPTSFGSDSSELCDRSRYRSSINERIYGGRCVIFVNERSKTLRRGTDWKNPAEISPRFNSKLLNNRAHKSS